MLLLLGSNNERRMVDVPEGSYRVSQIVPYLFFLSCPLSMGVMMWFMMRGSHDGEKKTPADARLLELEREVEELRTGGRGRETVGMR